MRTRRGRGGRAVTSEAPGSSAAFASDDDDDSDDNDSSLGEMVFLFATETPGPRSPNVSWLGPRVRTHFLPGLASLDTPGL